MQRTRRTHLDNFGDSVRRCAIRVYPGAFIPVKDLRQTVNTLGGVDTAADVIGYVARLTSVTPVHCFADVFLIHCPVSVRLTCAGCFRCLVTRGDADDLYTQVA